MKIIAYLKVPIVMVLAGLAIGQVAAQSITVPNGGFTSNANISSEAPDFLGLLGDYNRLFGTGPWRVQGSGILGLAAPGSSITGGAGGDASFAALVNASALGFPLLSTSGRVYQNNLTTLGVTPTFVNGTTYQLAADITSTGILTATVLTNNGIGIGLLADSTLTAESTGAGAIINVGLLSGNTYRVTLTYTADSDDQGRVIGIEGFTGRSPVVSIGALGVTSFDNFSLAIVPEPSSFALIGAAGFLGLMRRRR